MKNIVEEEQNFIVKEDVVDIFRIENPVTMNGMWYNQHGVYDPFIFTLTEGISAGLPMERDDRYGLNGQRWFSGCQSFEQLQNWFSERDVMELSNAGYKLFLFKSLEFIHEDFQTIFTRRGIIDRIELETSLLFT